jgi:hypothetical protein
VENLFVLPFIAAFAVVMSGVFWIVNTRRVRRNQEVESYKIAHMLLDQSVKLAGQSLQIDAKLLKARLDYAIKYGEKRDTAVIEEEFKTFLMDRTDFSRKMTAAINYDRKKFERLPLDYTNELSACHAAWRTIDGGLIARERELKDLQVKYFAKSGQ